MSRQRQQAFDAVMSRSAEGRVGVCLVVRREEEEEVVSDKDRATNARGYASSRRRDEGEMLVLKGADRRGYCMSWLKI